MRLLLVVICGLIFSQSVRAESNVYRVAVLADTDKTEGGWLAKLIADELQRSKDIVIDYTSPDLTVSCFAINFGGSRADRPRLAASVALMLGQHQLLGASSTAGAGQIPYARSTIEGLTRRCSQPLPGPISHFDFMKQFQIFATVAFASGGGRSSPLVRSISNEQGHI
jgi:hypothetical protein